jgi:thiamine biosynthesis lipoprotein
LRKLRPDISVDLSAIAVGYAVDVLATLLEAHGVRNYVVEIGGELRARGRNPEGRAWKIGVERPVPDLRSADQALEVDGAGVATSGDYRNSFEVDGRRYSHIIDPKSARPVDHDLASVTVVAPTAMRADALATGLMVLGPEAGYALAERKGIAAFFIRRAGNGFTKRSTAAFGAYAR